jgi:hypothetical protein
MQCTPSEFSGKAAMHFCYWFDTALTDIRERRYQKWAAFYLGTSAYAVMMILVWYPAAHIGLL